MIVEFAIPKRTENEMFVIPNRAEGAVRNLLLFARAPTFAKLEGAPFLARSLREKWALFPGHSPQYREFTGRDVSLGSIGLTMGTAGNSVLLGRLLVLLLAFVQCGIVLTLFPYAYAFRPRSWQMIVTLVCVFVLVVLTFEAQLAGYQWIESGRRPHWSTPLQDAHDPVVTTTIGIEGLLSLILIPSFISARKARQLKPAPPEASPLSKDNEKRSQARTYSEFVSLAICVLFAALGTADIFGHHIFFRTPRVLVVDSTICCFFGVAYFGWLIFNSPRR